MLSRKDSGDNSNPEVGARGAQSDRNCPRRPESEADHANHRHPCLQAQRQEDRDANGSGAPGRRDDRPFRRPRWGDGDEGDAQGHDRLHGGAEGAVLPLRRQHRGGHKGRRKTADCQFWPGGAGPSRPNCRNADRRLCRHRDDLRRQDDDDPRKDQEHLPAGALCRDGGSTGRCAAESSTTVRCRRPTCC